MSLNTILFIYNLNCHWLSQIILSRTNYSKQLPRFHFLSGLATSLFIYFTSVLASDPAVPAETEV